MSISFKSNLPSDTELQTLFGTIEIFEKFKVGDKVVTAGSTPILRRAKQLAPRDTKGHGKKRSKNQKNAVGASGKIIDWSKNLYTTIKRKVVKAINGAFAIIGPSWPDGNDAYFNSGPGGNKGHHWGYPGKTYPTRKGGKHVAGPAKHRVQIRNWIVQAADETRPEQLSAMQAKLVETIGDVIRG